MIIVNIVIDLTFLQYLVVFAIYFLGQFKFLRLLLILDLAINESLLKGFLSFLRMYDLRNFFIIDIFMILCQRFTFLSHDVVLFEYFGDIGVKFSERARTESFNE